MARTTETLREELFQAIKKVREKTMDAEDAKVIATLADKIIAAAKIEMDYALVLSKLDSDKTEIPVGPMLLTKSGDK